MIRSQWHTLYYFNAIGGTCWKVSEVIDFSLRNWISDLPACLLALIFDLWFFSVNQNSIIKNNENWVLRIFANLLFMDLWKWGKWAIYKFIRLEILLLLIHHFWAKDIAVVKSGRRNYFWSFCLYDTLKKLHHDTLSNVAKIRTSWCTFSNIAKIRYYCL